MSEVCFNRPWRAGGRDHAAAGPGAQAGLLLRDAHRALPLAGLPLYT